MAERTEEQKKATKQENAAETGEADREKAPDEGSAAAKGQSEEANAASVHGGPQLKPSPTKLKKGVLDKDAALKVLQDAFGSIATLSSGSMKVLAQKDFEAAYDGFYGEGPYSWAKYVKPKWGNLEGFAEGGTNYINADMASIDTVPHEMLHTNTASDWVAFVGSEFNEGTTEYMTIYAVKMAGKTPTHSYPSQEGCVSYLVSQGLSQADLFTAYLKGDAKTLVGKWVDDNSVGTWADVKTAMQASSWATAKAKMKKKP